MKIRTPNSIWNVMLACRVPDTYQEVEYVSCSNGAQYFDSGFLPDYTLGFKFQIEFGIDTAYRYCLASNYNSGGAGLSLELDANRKARLWLNNGSVDQRIGTINLGLVKNTVTFSYYNNVWRVDCNGTKASGNHNTTLCSRATMYVFLDRAKRTSTFPRPLRIYSLRMYSGDTLERDFIPCYRKSDNVIGMFDRVHRVFYVNEGSDSFLKGENQYTPPDVFTPSLPEEVLLPINYQRVTYLQSNGSQYIDTGLPVHMNWKYEIVFQQTDTSTYRAWGAFNQSSYRGPNCSLTYISNPKIFALRWESQSNNERYVALPEVDTNKHTLLVDNGEAFFDGVDKGRTAGHSTSFVSSCNAFLFTINPKGATPTATLHGKIYSYKVWDENGIMQQWFVPCYHRAHPYTAGFYDIIGEQFYTNIGTGSFTKGDDV